MIITTHYRFFVLIAAVAMLASTPACGRKAKSTPPTLGVSQASDITTPSNGAEQSSSPTEEATGELRDVILRLRRVHFAYDTTELTKESREILQRVSEILTEHPSVALYVQGHADARGSDEYNVALGDRRARTVADYLSALGVDRNRLHTVSYGEEQPLEYGDAEMSRAKNRRVDFRLMRGDVQLVVQDGTLIW